MEIFNEIFNLNRYAIFYALRSKIKTSVTSVLYSYISFLTKEKHVLIIIMRNQSVILPTSFSTVHPSTPIIHSVVKLIRATGFLI